MNGLNDIGGSVRPWAPLALRDVLFVHSKEAQGRTEPCKGGAIFLVRAIELLKLVDFGKSEIRREHRFVFLCGGTLNANALKPPSVREALLRYLPSRERINDARIILGERATEALPGSNFTNLLDLEEYISAIVDGVVLIVESDGSICELGAFVKTPEISDKLVILISSFHNNLSSFIKLGALKYFSEVHAGDPDISPFHWDILDGGVNIYDYVLDDIVTELNDSLKRIRPKGKLKLSNLGDRIFLTLSICHILRGAKLVEIRECYRALGMPESEKEVLKHLSILEICHLIIPVDHGKKVKYFVPRIERLPVKIAFKDDVIDRDRDTLRWIREISALIRTHEPARMRIFQEHQNGA